MSERRYRVLVCGSRDWTDRGPIASMLNGLVKKHGRIVVIEGGARGADSVAAGWTKHSLSRGGTEDMVRRASRAGVPTHIIAGPAVPVEGKP